MQPATLLVLLLAVAVAVGAAWLFLGAAPETGELEEDEALPEPPPREPDRAAPPARPEVVELPRDPEVERVAILAAGKEPPEATPTGPAPLDALLDSALDGDPSGLSGPDLVRAVARVAPLRLRNASDLEALRALGPDPEWPRGARIPLLEVVEYWRRAGFEVESRGDVLLLTRHGE